MSVSQQAASGAKYSTREHNSEIASHNPDDWQFCKRSLELVSRTFARPIEMLPDELQVAVTCGYLLCRAVDTIEDAPDLTHEVRDELYAHFLNILERGGACEQLAAAVRELPFEGAERELLLELARVMRVFRAQRAPLQRICVQWISEMARGMNLYSYRRRDSEGITALATISDLERYCFYVAGTVGHMLTELFVDAMGADLEDKNRWTMMSLAEQFGTGLQFVNILKDVTDDRERGWSFIPESVCFAQNISLDDLLNPAHRDRAHAVVSPVFDRARELLDGAFAYTLSIPVQHDGIRLFCLLPLWMAARTLVCARGNDAMFVPGQAVKIGRKEVEAIIAECIEIGGDDEQLSARYAQLWNEPTPAHRVGAPVAAAG